MAGRGGWGFRGRGRGAYVRPVPFVLYPEVTYLLLSINNTLHTNSRVWCPTCVSITIN